MVQFIYSINELEYVAKQIIQSCQSSKIFNLTGEMGAGKTTLIKSLCNQLGYHGHVNSPTFSIINEYFEKPITIYHMDLYRIKSQDELFDIDFENYLYSGHYCFIEWPQIAQNMGLHTSNEIYIETLDNDTRKLYLDIKNI